jgi:glycyl-tRNA synthetase
LTRHTEKTKERLVARERLAEPKVVEKTVLNINKKLFGPAFKKNAKVVENALLALSEDQLDKLNADLTANGGCVSEKRRDLTLVARCP